MAGPTGSVGWITGWGRTIPAWVGPAVYDTGEDEVKRAAFYKGPSPQKRGPMGLERLRALVGKGHPRVLRGLWLPSHLLPLLERTIPGCSGLTLVSPVRSRAAGIIPV